MILLTIITAVGLYRFWPPARPLYIASMGLSFLIAPMAPPVVQTALASTAQSVGMLAVGLMIGLMYFSPVASEFRRARI